ncbi:MAG: hypothetical protein QJR00_02235 [Bacillota bacterium]|nr:hypothetical protein [Bacillota bacterium]
MGRIEQNFLPGGDRSWQASPAQVKALTEKLSSLPVVVGVTYDARLQQAVIVIREVKSGRVVDQIPSSELSARLSRVERDIRLKLQEGDGAS